MHECGAVCVKKYPEGIMCFRRGSVWKSWNECLHVELVFCQKKGQQGGWSAVRTWTGTKKILTGQNVQRGGDQINHPGISCVEGIGDVERQDEKAQVRQWRTQGVKNPRIKDQCAFLGLVSKKDTMTEHGSFLDGRISKPECPQCHVFGFPGR